MPITISGSGGISGISSFTGKSETITVFDSSASPNSTAQTLNVTGRSYFSDSVGIGTTNPLAAVTSANTKVLAVGVVSATSYYGSGANLTGISATGRVVGVTTLTSGTSYTTPSTTTAIYVECIGAGGGGASHNAGAAGGGGGGGYSARYFPVSSNTAYTYAIGAAGAGAPAPTTNAQFFNGQAGGNTTFGPVGGTTLSAGGGGGGQAAVGDVIFTPGAGADGGTSSGGTVNASGQSGTHGLRVSPSPTVSTFNGGFGGSAAGWGGGGGKGAINPGTGAVNGQAGSFGGGGGAAGGGVNTPTGPFGGAGAAGGAGIIRVWELT